MPQRSHPLICQWGLCIEKSPFISYKKPDLLVLKTWVTPLPTTMVVATAASMQVVEGMQGMRTAGLLCDVTLVAESVEVGERLTGHNVSFLPC